MMHTVRAVAEAISAAGVKRTVFSVTNLRDGNGCWIAYRVETLRAADMTVVLAALPAELSVISSGSRHADLRIVS